MSRHIVNTLQHRLTRDFTDGAIATLTFPLDYFDECMRDEYRALRSELRESAADLIQDLLFRAAVDSKHYLDAS